LREAVPPKKHQVVEKGTWLLKATFLQPLRLLCVGLRGGRGGSIPLAKPSYVTGALVRVTLWRFCFWEKKVFRKRITVTYVVVSELTSRNLL